MSAHHDSSCHGGCHHHHDHACEHHQHGHHHDGGKHDAGCPHGGPRPPIKVDFDTQEWTELLAILEDMEDQEKACALLAELNEKSAAWGKLFMNLAPDLESDTWKKACDTAQAELMAVIKKIKNQGEGLR